MPSPPFDWNNYLAYARLLVAAGTSETTCRIATSRAYYAAYWKARQILETNGVTFPAKRSHDFCWRSFGRLAAAGGGTIREMGFALRDRRVHADYLDSPPLGKKSADSDVQDADDLVEALNNLSEADKQAAVQRANRMFLDYV